MNNMLDIFAIRSHSGKQQLQSIKKLKQRNKFLTWGNGYKIDYSSMSEN